MTGISQVRIRSTPIRWVFVVFTLGLLAIVSPAFADQTIVVVLDDSGSMRQRMRTGNSMVPRIEAAKLALSKVVAELPKESRLGILLLNSGKNKSRSERWLVPIGPLEAESTLKKIQRIGADGGTPLGASLKIAADALLEARQRQVYGDFRMLVVTDGEASDPELVADYLPDLLARGLTLDVIGVDMVGDHSLAKRSHSYRRAANAEDFEKAVREVFAESGSRSDLPGNSQDGVDDFDAIAGLPDDPEFSKKLLSALAVPDNAELHAADQVSPVEPITLNPSAPVNVPPAPPATNPVVAIFAVLPCCFSVIFFLAICIVVLKSMNKKKRR